MYAIRSYYEPKVFELMKKSIGHWVGFVGALQGYTYTGAAAMEAYLGNGNKALEYLNGLEQYLCPNTMYSEKGPVIETPLSATESIHYMLMQSCVITSYSIHYTKLYDRFSCRKRRFYNRTFF